MTMKLKEAIKNIKLDATMRLELGPESHSSLVGTITKAGENRVSRKL